MKQDIWPGKSWDPGFLVPEEHLSKALYWGTCQVILTLNWHKIDIRYTKWWNFTEHLKLIKSSLQVLCCLIDIVPISSDPLPLSQTFFNDYLRWLGHTQPKWLVCSCLYGGGRIYFPISNLSFSLLFTSQISKTLGIYENKVYLAGSLYGTRIRKEKLLKCLLYPVNVHFCLSCLLFFGIITN